MNFTKMILAALAAFIVMFMVDGLWWAVLLKDFYAAHMPPAPNESMLLHGVGELCLALLMAIIYPMGFKGGSALMEGVRFGFWVGLIYSLPGAIHMYAASGGSRMVPLSFVVNGLIIGMIGGVVIAMVYGNKAAAATT